MTPKTLVLGTHAFFSRDGATINSVVATALREKSATVCTITTATPHGLWVGAEVTVAGISGASAASYNGAATILAVPSATTFTYVELTDTAAEASTADTGGTVTLAGTISRTAKPGPNDAAWVDLGVIEEGALAGEGEDLKVFRPSPGRLRLHDIITVKDELMVKLTTKEPGPFHFEALFKTLALTNASTQFNPLEGPSTKKGWLKVQSYDHEDNLVFTLDLYVALKVTGEVRMGSELVSVEFEASVLHSSLNTGALV